MLDERVTSTPSEIEVVSMLLGERLVLRGIDKRIGTHPVVLPLGPDKIPGQPSAHPGYCVLFRYGAAVFFGVDEMARTTFIETELEDRLVERYAEPETESVSIRFSAECTEELDGNGRLVLQQFELSRIQIVAEVLAKSVVLAEYEGRLSRAFDTVEPLANDLANKGRVPRRSRDLLRNIGNTLRIEQQMVGRVEVGEKPELLWEQPELEKLYLRLEDEYEISERQVALDRKLALISSTTNTVLEVLQTSRSLRLEWYIVILIVIEILLSLYALIFKHHVSP